MKLKIGGMYFNRLGAQVKIIGKSKPEEIPKFPKFPFYDEIYFHYNKEGKYNTIESIMDLIEEITPNQYPEYFL